MSSNRLSGLNILLLVVTVLSLMVGAYGFIIGGSDPNGPSANTVVMLPDDEPLDEPREGPGLRYLDESDRDKPRETVTRPPVRTDTGGNRTPLTKPDIEIDLGPEDEPPTDSGNAAISGTVVGVDGQPFAGATVSAVRSDLDLDPPEMNGGNVDEYREQVTEFLKRAARETRTTTTDDSGNFRFTGLDESLAYDLKATTDAGSGEQDRVAAGDSAIILLSSESLLRGRVQTGDGTAVTEFTVSLSRANRRWDSQSRSFKSDDGTFAMPARNGIMELEVTAPGFTMEDSVEVEVGSDAEEVVVIVDQAAMLSGVVTDKSGTPLRDVVVRVGSADNMRGRRNRGDNRPSARTDSKGRYHFETLKPEETTVSATLGEMSENQKTTLAQGDNTLDFSIDVGAVLRLRLTSPGGDPLDADRVWFQRKEGRGWPRPERLPGREPGLAEFAGLQPGEYVMTVTSGGYPAIRRDIEVTGGENDIALSFTSGAMLAGAISSSSGGTIGNLGVRLRKEDEERWGGWGTGRYAQVDDDGAYKLGPAEPGQWRIEVYTRNNWNEVYSSTITLSEGENTHNIVVDGGSTVIVTLVDEEGNAVGWGNVQLRGEHNYNQRTDAEGKATLAFVELGGYTLSASGRGLASRSQFISLRSGDNQYTLTLQRPNCARLTRVYDDSQASRIGLEVGDLVVSYNGESVTGWGDLGRKIRQTQSSDEVTISVERNGVMLTFNLNGGTVGIDGTDAVR